MLELIEKLEMADKGSVELDALIGAHIGFDGWSPQTWQEFLGRDDVFPPQAKPSNLPSYTTSLDAALTLVPEDKRWIAERSSRRFHAAVYAVDGFVNGHASSAPLAICIAALKARVAA